MWPRTRPAKACLLQATSLLVSLSVLPNLQLLSFQTMTRQELIHWPQSQLLVEWYQSHSFLPSFISLAFYPSLTPNLFFKVKVVTVFSPKWLAGEPSAYRWSEISIFTFFFSFLLSSQKLKECAHIKEWDKAWTGNPRANTEWWEDWSWNNWSSQVTINWSSSSVSLFTNVALTSCQKDSY